MVDLDRPNRRSNIVQCLVRLLRGEETAKWLPVAKPRAIELFSAIGLAYSRMISSASAKAGAFYTPLLVSRRLAQIIYESGARPTQIVDPACGGGALLLACVEAGLGSCYIGWDVDKHAITLCRSVLETFAEERAIDLDLRLEVRDLFRAETALGDDDFAVMNPPFGTRLGDSAREYARAAQLTGREPDLFALALERMMGLAEGVAAIVPDVIRMQPEYFRMRAALTESGRISHLERLPFGVFPGAAVQPNLLLVGPKRRGGSFRAREQDGSQQEIDCSTPLADDLCRWRLGPTALEVYWERWPVRLGEIAHCHEGVHTGNIRAKLFTSDRSLSDARPMLKGADIRPFASAFNGRYIRYDSTLINRKEGDYASLRKPEIFDSPKLLSRQTASRLIVCLDRESYITDNTLHTIRVRAEHTVPLEWLALYLNSSLATALYRYQSGEFDRPLPQIKLAYLRALPIPNLVDRDRGLALYAEAEQRAKVEPLPGAFLARIDRFVFDTVGVPASDWPWILRYAQSDSRGVERKVD